MHDAPEIVSNGSRSKIKNNNGNKKHPDISLSTNSENFARVYQTKFLRVIIESHLKWNAHITSISNKISKTIGILNKAKHILATNHLKMLYRSLI